MVDTDVQLAQLLSEEEELQFDEFDLPTAWALGEALVSAASASGHPLAIDIRFGEQQVFHAALPGSSADNDAWIRRKARTVSRFGHSSYLLAVRAEHDGDDFEERYRLDRARFAASGGSFPLLVRGAGMTGTITVSGLPGARDHAFLVSTLRAFLAARKG